MPNTLTSIFVSNPATEPVEAPHPNTGVYVTGTQAVAGGPWTVVHTLITKTTTPLTMVGRLKNFPAVTVSVVAAGGPNAGNIFNNVLATPTGAAATGTSSGTINVTVSSIANQAGYRLLAGDASTGPFTQLYQGTTASYLHTGLAALQTKFYSWQYVGGAGTFYDDSAVSAVFSGTSTAAAQSVANRTFAAAAGVSTQITDYLPAAFVQSTLLFSAAADVAALTATFSTATTNATVQSIEGEGSGWTFQDNTNPSGWTTSAVGPANRGTASVYSKGGPTFPRSRTETLRSIDVFAQQDPTLGTLVLRLTRGGTATTYQFPQSGTANSGDPSGTTPQITVDLGTGAATLIELYSSVAGQYCAFDAITIRNSTSGTDSPATLTQVGSNLQLAPQFYGQLNAVTAKSPVGGWWTVEADIASAVNPTAFTYADLFFGVIANSQNYFGGVFHAKTGHFQAVYRQNGVDTFGPDLGGGLALPGSVKVVCTGSGLTLLYRNSGSAAWVDLPSVWYAPAAIQQASQYNGTYKYGVFGSASAGGWDVQISGFRAGHFGATCVGDNSMVLNDDGTPVIQNNKRLWAGSLRGFCKAGDTFQDFIRNNMCGILSEDLTTGAFALHSLVWHSRADTTEIQGEGSPCFVRDQTTNGFHSVTPRWSLATTNGVTQVRNAYGYTALDITVKGSTSIIASTVKICDALKPNEVAYDGSLTKLADGSWAWCYTVQYLNGEQGQGFQMYMKLVNTTDFNTFTVVKADITTGTAAAYEGVRLLLLNGVRAFWGAGYTNIKGMYTDGTPVTHPDPTTGSPVQTYFAQPTALQSQQYASHFAAYQTTVNGDPNRIHYIAFDNTRYRTDWQYAYGITKSYVSDPV